MTASIRNFSSIVFYDCLQKIYENKGYKFFDQGNYNLNIGAFRMTTGTDLFDDVFFIAYRQNGEKIVELFEGTTDPGSVYLKSPIAKSGTFIMVAGQHRGVYKIGPHGKTRYEALRQCKAIPGYRDNNRDEIHNMDPSTIENDIFWTNYHHGYDSATVKYNSAGCQVVRYKKDLERVLELCKVSQEIYGPTFTYTLLEKKDLGLN